MASTSKNPHAGFRDGDVWLRARLDDAVQLSEAHSCPRFVGFLDERQRAMAQAQLKVARGVNVSFYGGHDEAERTLCGIFPDFMEPEPALFPLTALAFRFRAEAGLTHRDFLGSLLSCGVKRETVGDILCGDGLAVSFVDENVAPFLCGQLTKVGGRRGHGDRRLYRRAAGWPGLCSHSGYGGLAPAGRGGEGPYRYIPGRGRPPDRRRFGVPQSPAQPVGQRPGARGGLPVRAG